MSLNPRKDPFAIIKKLEAYSPRFSNVAAMYALGILSPFNRHLGAKLKTWTDSRCIIELKCRRRVRNHVGSIHAGALFTLGETCAGLIIIRNFPFRYYRPLMSDVSVSYTKQARGNVTGEAEILDTHIIRMKDEIALGLVPSLEVKTIILNQDREQIATVLTQWQVKPWQLVKTQASTL